MTSTAFTDQLENKIQLMFPPKRIISLVPSQTELLADLGLEGSVVGITRFCVHPEHWRTTKAIVGGTKKFDFESIQALNPDLIIGNKEENYQQGIEALRKHYPVWMSDIISVEDALSMILRIGELTDRAAQSKVLVSTIRNSFKTINPLPTLRTLYLIWKNPFMAAASGTFIHEIMTLAGLQNCLSDRSRYPELSLEDIKDLNPEIILLSSEPYPFRAKHIEELQNLIPKARVLLVDGEMFSWYGSRLLKVPGYLKELRTVLS